ADTRRWMGCREVCMKACEAALPARAEARVIPLRRDRARRRDELAFLPAALEIVETPPSPTGRLIAATIMLVFCAALAWAAWARIDIVATATGKIGPSGSVKVGQPFDTGIVRAIHVEDGPLVETGGVLIERDPTLTR